MKTVRLGELIEIYEIRNSDNKQYEFLGINKDKLFMPSVANTEFVDARKYKIIKKEMFVFSGMQTGRDMCIRLGLYTDEKPGLLSPAYTTFIVKNKKQILPDYLFLLFNRNEMDRFGAYLSDGSVRANLDWEVFSDIEIPLPDLETQKQIVASYNGLKNVIDDNMALVEPLEKLCHAYIVDLKKKYPSVALGDYIHDVDEKNSDNKIKEVRSVSVTKEFKLTNAKVDKNDLRNYLIVKPKQMAFVQTTGNEKCLCCAYNDFEYSVVVSSVDKVIESNNENVLNLQFLHLYLVRKEFDRYARYNSWGSAREVFTMEDMNRVKIPLPPIEVQQSIVNIYNCAQEAKKTANEAKEELKKLCPALVQFAAKSA